MAINEIETGNQAVAITGTAKDGEETVGIRGLGDSVGVRGDGKNWHGVAGLSESTIGGNGVFGANKNGTGVRGESETRFNAGVFGLHKGEGGWGVLGEAGNGTGIAGVSKTWHGVYGETSSTVGGAGVHGKHLGSGTGIAGESTAIGVLGTCESGIGVLGQGPVAGRFEGLVEVTGDLFVRSGIHANNFFLRSGSNLATLQADLERLEAKVTALDRKVTALEKR